MCTLQTVRIPRPCKIVALVWNILNMLFPAVQNYINYLNNDVIGAVSAFVAADFLTTKVIYAVI